MESWPSYFPNPTINYSVNLDTNIARTQQATGRILQRRQTTRDSNSYPVSWFMNDDKYELFESWRFIKISGGADWFYVNLLQGGGFKKVQARIVAGTYRASYNQFLQWDISCVLEVEDIPHLDEEELNNRLILGDSTIDELEAAVAAQEQFYNVDLYSTYNFKAL